MDVVRGDPVERRRRAGDGGPHELVQDPQDVRVVDLVRVGHGPRSALDCCHQRPRHALLTGQVRVHRCGGVDRDDGLDPPMTGSAHASLPMLGVNVST